MTHDSVAAVSARGKRARWPALVKRGAAGGVAPNLYEYGRAWAEFSWEEARRKLAKLRRARGRAQIAARRMLGI